MVDYEIRRATLDDLPILLEFEQGIVKAERPYDPTLDNDPISYYDIADLIGSALAEVLVAQSQGEVIASGYAKIKKAQPFLNHSEYSYLGFMYTCHEHRGKGVNRMIVDALKDWSIAQGMKEIRLTVYEDNHGAIKAYEKVGFQKHLIEMRLV